MKNVKKIGFLGVGNIATAIIKGMLGAELIKPEALALYDPNAERLAPFTQLGAVAAKDMAELTDQCELLFLTVKPQVLPDLAPELAPLLSESTLIISPVAGISTERLNKMLGGGKKIIRVMPNTPLTCSAGATAIAGGEGVSPEQLQTAEEIFSASGVTARVTEDKMDTITALSGSSPAFFMRFLREIIKEGTRLGLDEETAKRLATQTMGGTATMVTESLLSIDELIRAVASPGGTTEAGLKKMDESGFDDLTAEVIRAAKNRSTELNSGK